MVRERTRRLTLKRDEVVSIVALVLLGLALPIGVSTGLWSMASVLEYVPYFIMGAMVGIFLWGFRERIEGWAKRIIEFKEHEKNKETKVTLRECTPIQSLVELEKGLTEIINKPPDSFVQSSDRYIGQIQFRAKVAKYVGLESEAEALLHVDHQRFYLNPDLLEASQAGQAQLTNTASDLLVMVKEYRIEMEKK